MADEPCMFYVGWADPNDLKSETIISMQSRGMTAAQATTRDLPVIQYRPTKRIFKTGDILWVDWTPVSTDDWVVAASIMSVPVTIKNTRTDDKEEADIELSGKYAFTTNAASLVGTAGERKRAAWYVVPEGMSFVIGKKRAHNSRLLLTMGDT